MSNTNNNTISIDALIAFLESQKKGQVETPKTSAKLKSSNDDTAKLKLKGTKTRTQDIEPDDEPDTDVIEIRCLDRADKRVRIPKHAFNSKGICYVDGVKYTAKELDGFRSTKLSPATFDAETGDTVILTRISGNKWESEVAKARKPKGTKTNKTSGKLAKKTTATKTKKDFGTLDEQLNELAKAAIKQAKKGFVNEYIEQYSRFETDARLYLTTAQNKRIKGIKFANNLTLGQIVEMLNEKVFE